jgi:transposase
MVKTAEQLRAALAGTERRGAGRPYPAALRREVVAYVKARRDQGIGLVAAAREIGVSAFSVTRWRSAQRSGPESTFRKVVVTESCADAVILETMGIVVHGPRGLRLEGLPLQAVAELWQRLL